MTKLRASLLAVAVTLMATTQVAGEDHRHGDPPTDEQAAAELTAAVLGDELTPKTHPRTLGLYWDHDFGGYAIVIPDAGDLPGPDAFAEFGIPYRLETSSLTPEGLAEIQADAHEFMQRASREEGHSFGAYYDARRDIYKIQGTAPRSEIEDLLASYPDHLRYRRVEPIDEWRRAVRRSPIPEGPAPPGPPSSSVTDAAALESDPPTVEALDDRPFAPAAGTVEGLPSAAVTEEVEPGVLRILHDGFRDPTGEGGAELPATYAKYLQTHVVSGITAGKDGSI